LTLSTISRKADALPSALLGFDSVDQIGAAWRKPIRLLSAFGAWTYFDYRQNPIREAIFIDLKDGFLQ
jgi:hypothetical protein